MENTFYFTFNGKIVSDLILAARPSRVATMKKEVQQEVTRNIGDRDDVTKTAAL